MLLLTVDYGFKVVELGPINWRHPSLLYVLVRKYQFSTINFLCDVLGFGFWVLGFVL